MRGFHSVAGSPDYKWIEQFFFYRNNGKGQVIGLYFFRQIRQNRVIAYIGDVMACIFSDSEQARRCAKRNAVIQILAATAAFVLLVRIYPMGMVQSHTISKQQAFDVSARDELTGDVFTSKDKKLQTVYFEKEHIYQIKLYLQCTVEGDAQRILFRLYDDAFSCIYEEDIDSKQIEKRGFLAATPDIDVETGKPYYYEILIPEDSQAVYMLPIADRGALAQTENSTLYIDGIINDEVSLIADFDYSRPLSIAGIFAYDILILASAGLIYLFLAILIWEYDHRLSQYSAALVKYLKIGTGAASIASAVVLFVYSVILNKFGGELWDRLFFAAGIIVSQLWILGALRSAGRSVSSKKQFSLSAGSKICLVWRNYIQTVSFGLLFYALCQYVNADRNFYHYTNTRWMLIFLAIAFLMNYNEKQFVNKFSAVWLVLGAAGSVLYCSTAEGDDNAVLLARLTCGVVVAWGLLIGNIILYQLRYQRLDIAAVRQNIQQNKQRTVYIGLWLLFCILMYVYRYEKVWVFTATLPFTAMFFTKNTIAFKSRFLKNFTNGILLSFAMVTVFCLAHRPHHYWMLYRYGGIFHTVACTGMYLAVVLGAALAKLYGKLKNKKQIFFSCYLEYFAAACATGFILLTMSRTAMLTTVVTVLAIVLLTAVTFHKDIRRIVSELGILAGVCLLSFPMIFTAVRMVPAVVNDPVRYDIEFQDSSFMIYEGDPIDSDKYMTVGRFFATFFGRFQTQEEEQAADARLAVQEKGLLAYAGYDFAGIDMRTIEGENEGAPEDTEEDSDISNGRFAIFQAYLKASGLKGHPKMGPEKEDGEEYPHAHNSYLQIAYNFGMIAGGIFLILCGMTLWRAIRLYMENSARYSIFLVPFALVVVFGFVSLTEWAFHPCIPAGFSFMLMQALIMHTGTEKKNVSRADGCPARK